MGSAPDESLDVQAVSNYFDAYGDREWDRLEETLHGRVAHAIHSALLSEHIRPGMHVADLGCGPGRFAIDIINAGAAVTLVDVSRVQLDAALARIGTAGLQDGVRDAREADIRQLGCFENDLFDSVVCFGGALSYVREYHRDAFADVVRIARPGVPILFSVMSLLGTLTLAGTLDSTNFLERMASHLDWLPPAALPPYALTLPESDEFHLPMALFTSGYLREMCRDAGCEVLAMAAANPISRLGLPLQNVTSSPVAASQFQSLELAMSRAPGMVDAGSHIVVAARKRR